MGPPVKVSVLARRPYCSCEHRLCSPGAQRSRRASRAASPFAPFAHRIRLNELQLELRAVPSIATYTHDDLRADRLNGRFAPPDLPTSSGSFRIVCNFHPSLTTRRGRLTDHRLSSSR